ncbi:MAG TPA: hypothetical protein VFT15_02580 [Chitinophagaceae bacterium]|nr:hypothetical protein [Chitinophagaceae bacterium]
MIIHLMFGNDDYWNIHFYFLNCNTTIIACCVARVYFSNPIAIGSVLQLKILSLRSLPVADRLAFLCDFAWNKLLFLPKHP